MPSAKTAVRAGELVSKLLVLMRSSTDPTKLGSAAREYLAARIGKHSMGVPLGGKSTRELGEFLAKISKSPDVAKMDSQELGALLDLVGENTLNLKIPESLAGAFGEADTLAMEAAKLSKPGRTRRLGAHFARHPVGYTAGALASRSLSGIRHAGEPTEEELGQGYLQQLKAQRREPAQIIGDIRRQEAMQLRAQRLSQNDPMTLQTLLNLVGAQKVGAVKSGPRMPLPGEVAMQSAMGGPSGDDLQAAVESLLSSY